MPVISPETPATPLSGTYTLTNDIATMQVVQASGDKVNLSPVSKLPGGAKIEACGMGFNSKTLKVCFGGLFYFVFTDELAAGCS